MLDGTSIFLIGMMGAGKSTIAKLLAPKLGYKFFDTDRLIEDYTGRTVSQLFAEVGETEFREIERQILAEVSTFTRLSIATGGGIVLHPLNWSHLRDGVIVWLDVAVPILFERLKNERDRPLLQNLDPLATLTSIYQQRRDRYAQADICLQVQAHETDTEICDRLLTILAERLEINRLKFPEKSSEKFPEIQLENP